MTTNSNLPTKIINTPLMDPDAFAHMQRVGQVLALSPLFPDHLRKGTKESAVANGVLVMNMAMRLNEDPLTVAQNIYFVGGKPGWSASYMISKANQHGVFKNPIDWKVEGSGENLSVTAQAELTATGKKVSVTCDMAMAKAEGWTKNAKYTSMPEQMLRYRSATFLIRLYCPEVMVGVPSTIEIETGTGMKDVTPAEVADRFASATDDTEEAETVEDNPEEQDKGPTKKPEQKQSAEKPDDGPASAHQAVFESLVADLADGMPVERVDQFYSEKLDAMKRDAPDLHASLMKEIEEWGAQ
jgi:hypothetical protein